MPRYAAIDIGSNSVRMLAAEVVPGNPVRILAEDREVTRLGTSVFSGGRISEEAAALVASVLRRMADAYSKLEVVGVRAVATSAVRDASNRAEFIARASEAAGVPVEIVSGPEEARLIHLGVQSRWPHPKHNVLVIDVGGGSAEFIVSERGEMREGVSRPLGAVRLTEVFLQSDPPAQDQLHRLVHFIDDKFEPAWRRISGFTFDRVIGTSATAAAIVSAVNEVPRSDRDAADRLRARTSQVRELYRDLSARNLAKRKKLPGIGPRRAEIIVAGAAVFARVLERLKASGIYYSVAGVRDGIIADLAARGVGSELSRLNPQQRRVADVMCKKYSADVRNARYVAERAAELFDNLQPLHKLTPGHGKLLEAAAYLHNTGHFISDTGHHKHSAYIVSNSDMPGYTDTERLLVSMLCRYHRKSLPAQRHEPFGSLDADSKRVVTLLTPLLRLAIGLDSSKEQKVHSVECQLSGAGATLALRGTGDFDLELWAAEQAAQLFRQVYDVPLSVAKMRR
jgi:exopolyphosphatase/guanosine-5'-triphosphate,3'-diphosphate pyrophosphatase